MALTRSTLAALAILCAASHAAANEFDTYVIGLTECSDVLQDGRLELTACYQISDDCDFSSAIMLTTVPGTFSMDFDWDITKITDYTTLQVSTVSSGVVFQFGPPLFQDGWCEPAPCGGQVDDISFHVEAGDVVRFDISTNSEPCSGGGNRAIFSNLDFVPDTGIIPLGRSLSRAAIRETFVSPEPGTGFAQSLDTIPDLDGDGIEDVIVGKPWLGEWNNSAGHVQVLSGDDGALIYEFDGLLNSWMGWDVADAGDVDNDGVHDIITGEPRTPANGNNKKGRVRVFSGVDGSLVWELNGAPTNSDFGYVVDGVGDLDNDGHAEFVVGARYKNVAGLTSAGRVRVYSGFDKSIMHVFDGDAAFDYFGEYVAGVGDVDLDGFPDVAASSSYSDLGGNGGGVVRVFSGDDGALIYEWFGDQSEALQVLDGAGDFDNDGFADVLISAPRADARNGGLHGGRVEVRSGFDGSALMKAVGKVGNDNLGRYGAGVGDIDDDGFADVAVTNHTFDVDSEVRVFRGPTGQSLMDVQSPNHARVGRLMAGIADVDGDGTRDLLVSANTLLNQPVVLTRSGDPADIDAPDLRGDGALVAGTPFTLSISSGPPGAPAVLFLGLGALDFAFAGGYLVPDPDVILTNLTLNGSGALQLTANWPAALTAPASLVAQAWIVDGAAPQGFVVTNAVALDPP